MFAVLDEVEGTDGPALPPVAAVGAASSPSMRSRELVGVGHEAGMSEDAMRTFGALTRVLVPVGVTAPVRRMDCA
jgi:hypothetical protein